jgi:hypothetical protein
MILQGLKPWIFKRLDKFRARWVAELQSKLWSLRTTPCWATRFTPFFMVHDSEAVLPTDIDYGSPRVRAYTKEGNQLTLEDTIDNSTRRAMKCCCKAPSTSRPCGVATSATCAPTSFTSGILFSDEFKAAVTPQVFNYRH